VIIRPEELAADRSAKPGSPKSMEKNPIKDSNDEYVQLWCY